ncbi:MAG TPA: thioesterase family protein [Opitutaceae bacterium]|jgi:1,4-dihydroxy-2-naphthoyl-CoA hydrolase|nr:thioesterase family protein [Opitutaceae bacterium]HOF10395.1 thioesterase family protein [Opitutaceae bacterium]HOR25737.1 thioesterase family protein [Opitutaceae bacterium]HOY54889.1 thioesterase family protein [Opitutaceae bacterium]HPG18750.1 thioesterase family protein [Opitutaceae bacterium]
MSYAYSRTIHFADTDAAGVVYFARYLSICHEAYEEALAAAGIDIKNFFSATGVMIPVSRSETKYLRPLVVGDKILVNAQPEFISENTYAVRYEIVKLGKVEKLIAEARTEHVCIDAKTRERQPLPHHLATWVNQTTPQV